MYSLYNFIGSWQLIPEKSEYSLGVAPKSMIYQFIEKEDRISAFVNWYTYDGESMQTDYSFNKDEGELVFDYHEVAEKIETKIASNYEATIIAIKDKEVIFENKFTITPKGLLIIEQSYLHNEGVYQTKKDVFHKQLSVLPYAHSVSGVAIIPTAEGTIKHKALQAMAEQTDMHLDQIKKQIELLALQANEIKRRKELSLLIYDAKINFTPQIGQVYHLYEKKDGNNTLSLVAPKEWGGGAGPFKAHLGGVKLLADHTWTEIE